MAPSPPAARPGPLTKPAVFRSIATSRVDKKHYSQSSQPCMPAHPIIEQFRVHRNRAVEKQGKRDDENEEINDSDPICRRRISYIKKQKLEAISYATTTWIEQKNGSIKFINKQAAANHFGITSTMLRK